VTLSPNDDFSRAQLGIVISALGDQDAALKELNHALALNPKSAMAHVFKGIVAANKGWQGTARAEFETALSIKPDYADAHFNLAVLYSTQLPPDKEHAKKHYERARQLGADRDEAIEQALK